MDEPAVLVQRSGQVAVLTLNRPARLNVLNSELVHAATAGLAELGADESLSVVVLTGAGGAFVAGADVREMRAFNPGGGGEDRATVQGLIG